MNRFKFASLVDHSLLKPDATVKDFEKLCSEAREYKFASVAVNSYPVSLCRKLLEGSNVLTGAAISFPLGQTTIKTKTDEAKNAFDDGAEEIDYVMNIAKAKEHDWAYIEREMTAMTETARERGMCIKVILETCLLEKEEIIEVSKIASRVKPDFIKTSTGFSKAGASVENVLLMKKYSGDFVKVKAAGGIRHWKEAEALIKAGAERLGCSAGIQIIKELEEEE